MYFMKCTKVFHDRIITILPLTLKEEFGLQWYAGASLCGLLDQLMCIFSIQQHHLGSLKSAMLGKFTPWKLTKATSVCCLPRELLTYTVHNLDLFAHGTVIWLALQTV